MSTNVVKSSYPLSSVQHGMLFHHLQAPDSGVDVEQMVCTLPGSLDVSRFHEAWRRAAAHHPALRTAFRWDGLAEPLQEVQDAVELPLVVHDWLDGTQSRNAERVETFLRQDRRAGFKFDDAPLMRLGLLRVSQDAYRFVWTFSHAIVDGNAFTDLLREVFHAYDCLVHGRAVSFAPRPLYADYISWLAGEVSSKREASKAFWRKQLHGFSVPTQLPQSNPEDPSVREAGDAGWAAQSIEVSRDVTQALRQLAETHNLTLNTFVQGAWAQTLAAHTGQRDVVFGVTRACRRGTVPEAERMIGLFINTLPLRVALSDDITVTDWLKAIRDQHRAVRDFEHTPLVDVQGESEIRGGAGLFSSIIVFNDGLVSSALRAGLGPDQAPHIPSDVDFIEQTNFPLTLFGYAEPALLLKLTYDPRRYDAPTIGRLLALVRDVLVAMVSAPQAARSTLPSASTDEHRLMQEWNRTERPFELRCVHELIEAQVARTPDATALTCGDARLTYRQLDQRADQLALVLRSKGVGPESLVGLCIERSLDMAVGLLGILKAGAAYVPLDPVYPRQRLAMMLEDSKAKLLITQRHLVARLPTHNAEVLCIDELRPAAGAAPANVKSGVTPDNLAYVIFTSGSSGRPKGVMVQHKNVANFFRGMDDVVGTKPGVWLAVTSISFDISVLELFWTLARGFTVVIQRESDRASLAKATGGVRATSTPMGFGLFYFAASPPTEAPVGNMYRLLLEGARFADTHDFAAVWTPERHFHAFGGLYPNPAVTTAALATITSRVQLRAGSVVLPLHDPLRVAEDWSVIDQLSNGRVGLSFASGWHANDFAFFPGNFERRREIMVESIETIRKIWRGESVSVKNGVGELIDVKCLPRPLQERPGMWIASAGSPETFKVAGRLGANVLTNMLGQDLNDLKVRIAAYRDARREAGHEGDGVVSVMLHTFVCDDTERARELTRKPFCNYLASSFDLVKVAPWMFPAFKQPSRQAADDSSYDPNRFTTEDMAALLEHAFDRYFDTAGLFGTPERALEIIEQLKAVGANEVACLIDFGVDPDVVLESLPHLDRLRQLANPGAQTEEPAADRSIAEQIRLHDVTHMQCTPSMARMLTHDPEAIESLKRLQRLLLGGEALPADLVGQLAPVVSGEIINMYGPTETTVWSTTSPVSKAGEAITIGRPIANTQIRIVDARLASVPIGAHGELCIGGAGVVRGYFDRPDLTQERFVADPQSAGASLYRTGDLARFRSDGAIEYLGRIDQQVKVNGYRIELGEIEAVLARHSAVKQAVVAVKPSAGGPALVGYVIARAADGVDEKPQDAVEEVGEWKRRWNEAYTLGTGADRSSPRFNTAGWLDSASGEPIAQDAMREWLDQTVSRILEHKPKRVLEIGCGTGMILYACLPHVEHFTGVDLSPFALETIRNELSKEELGRVTLLNHAAHELDSIAPGSCDLVIINSVAQYFPNVEYLAKVLARASELLVDGGHIFLGDIRSLEEHQAFNAWVELHHAPGQAGASELARRIADRTADETELLLRSAFFEELTKSVPRLSLRSVQLKRGVHDTEMRNFRCDVVLQAGPALPALQESSPELERLHAPSSIDAIRDKLAKKPAALWIDKVKNPRLDRLHQLAATLRAAGASDNVDSLRAQLNAPGAGIDPNDVYALDADYTVELRFSATRGEYEALLRHKQRGPQGRWAVPALSPGVQVANTPHLRFEPETLIPKLKAHLKDFLPEFMVPSAFVMLEELPLTPNGKIDRNALPAPADKARQAAAEYAVPANELERTIATIWQELLSVERVGSKDNIFDLGANSLLTMEANLRLQKALARKVPLVSMFRFPTIESLATHLSRPAPGADAAAPPGTGAAAVDAAEQERQNRVAAAAERRRQARARNQ